MYERIIYIFSLQKGLKQENFDSLAEQDPIVGWNIQKHLHAGNQTRLTQTQQEICHFHFNIFITLHYCPAVFGHVLDPPGNDPRGAIFPTMD